MTYEEENYYKELRNKYTHPLMSLLEKEAKTDIPLLSEYISLMKDKKALNKISYLGLTLDEMRALETMLNDKEKHKLKKSIYLYLNTPTEITFDEYKKLTKSFNLYSVVVNGLIKTTIDEHNNFAKILDSKLWYEYLKNLDKLTNGIKDSLINDESGDKEKRCFACYVKELFKM